MRRLLALAAIACLASPAWAEEAIPTAGAGATPTASPTAGPLDPSGVDNLPEERPTIGPCGVVHQPGQPRDAKADQAPHGQIEVGVGTGGYRHIGGVVCKPIGENGSVTVAVDHTEWNGGGRRHLVAHP